MCSTRCSECIFKKRISFLDGRLSNEICAGTSKQLTREKWTWKEANIVQANSQGKFRGSPHEMEQGPGTVYARSLCCRQDAKVQLLTN